LLQLYNGLRQIKKTMDKIQFQDGYVLALDDPTGYDDAGAGPMLGNGKLALMPNVTSIDTRQSMVGADFPIRHGSYASNLVPGFHVCNVQFFRPDEDVAKVLYTLQNARLNMSTGIYTAAFDITAALSGDVYGQVEFDLYVLRPYPYCIMQTFRVTVPAEYQPDACFFHHVYATSSMANPTFNSVLIHGDNVASGPGVCMTTAVGKLAHGTAVPPTYANGSAAPSTLAAASVYLFEEPGSYEIHGNNVYKHDLYRSYTKVRMLPDSSTPSGSHKTYRFHVLTAMMTDADFPDPAEEVKRIVLNLRNKAATPADVASRLRAEHVRAWAAMWSSDVHIDLKPSITEADAYRASRYQRALRYALYTTYTCTREGVNIDINPMNLSVADFDGSVMTDGDLWLVPMLLLIKPEIAKAILEYKHKTIQTAIQLAASYGYRGAKFPYHTDVLGYKSSLYWDAVSPLYIFNTAVVAINAWNYYRITSDKEWMYSKGYTILKAAADFLVSFVELQDADDPGMRRYVFKNVVGISGMEGDNNAFTVYTARLALRYALEASYDLQYPPRETWSDVYYNLSVPFFQNELGDVIKVHNAYPTDLPTTGATPTTLLNIMEPLMVLLPYFNSLLFGVDTRLTSTSLYKMLDFYRRRTNPEFLQHPLNIMLEMGMLAQLAQTDGVYVDAFYDRVDAFLDVCTDATWGNFLGYMKPPGSGTDTPLAAMFVLVFLQSLGGLRIAGGVTETRFMYEDFRIKTTRSGIMPSTWRQLRISGIGKAKQTAIVTNKLFYN
jgi:Glycosyl hydrolase family 65 central catalytic domain